MRTFVTGMRSRFFTRLLPLLAVSPLGLAACTNDIVAGVDANTSSTHALLVVEQTVPVQADDATRSHASMWFLRVADEQSVDTATRLVADVVEVPALGTCANVGVPASEPVPASLSPIELAFAGEVAVESGAVRVPLAMRAFPDVANVVSGVMYTAPGQSDLALPLGGPFGVSASGADGISGLVAKAEAPVPPRSVKLDGLSLDDAELEARRGAALAISWQQEAPGDLIYVDIDPVPGSPSDRVRCAMPDSGAGSISSSAIPETSTMSLSVHRVRVAPLHTPSGDIGTAHFDVAISARVKVAAQ